MGMTNCSGPCELCVNNGHCLAGRGDDDFQLDVEKTKSAVKNWWNTYVIMPLRRELILNKENKQINQDEPKEEKTMPEEKNMTTWLPCVVSDDIWRINDFVNVGDHIYRIFNDKIDIKANMIIKSIGYCMIGLHLIDLDVDISNIEIDEKLRVCQTSSENDPGTLVMKQDLNYNKELKPGCLYRVVDSELNFKYLMYIRCFSDTHIDADIMKVAINGKYSKIKTEHEQLSIIDFKDLMFNQISFTKGCNLKIK